MIPTLMVPESGPLSSGHGNTVPEIGRLGDASYFMLPFSFLAPFREQEGSNFGELTGGRSWLTMRLPL